MERRKLPFGLARPTFVLAAALLAALAMPATAQAAVSRSYSFSGYEVWATSTVGTFAGTATGSSGDLATWRAAIEHTVVVSPTGEITGGYAELLTSDLTRVRGTFSKGTLTLVSEGSGSCGTLTHEVEGKLVNVVRSDTGAVGKGKLKGILTHYRISLFGQCFAYSASARGTISLAF
jgi:hypothetical protein